jgi:hypothetical protein
LGTLLKFKRVLEDLPSKELSLSNDQRKLGGLIEPLN